MNPGSGGSAPDFLPSLDGAGPPAFFRATANYVIPNDYTEADFDALAEYSSRNPVVYAGYTILSPMPGTVFYKEVEDQIVEHDYSRYNFFNSVLRTKLPYERFHERVGGLWLIKKGKDVI